MFGSHDNSIIQHNGKNVLLYDTKKHMNLKKKLCRKRRFHKWVSSYRKSLVSIKGKNVSHRQGDVLDLVQQYFEY